MKTVKCRNQPEYAPIGKVLVNGHDFKYSLHNKMLKIETEIFPNSQNKIEIYYQNFIG